MGGLCLAAVCLCAEQFDAQPSEPEWAILVGARPRIESAEGGIFSVGGVVTTPPLMAEQVGAASAVWHDPAPEGALPVIRVSVAVYGIATAEAAASFFDDRLFSEGWVVRSYALGDQATLATFRDSLRHGIQFRHGRFLVFVNGSSIEEVERVARHVLLAATERPGTIG